MNELVGFFLWLHFWWLSAYFLTKEICLPEPDTNLGAKILGWGSAPLTEMGITLLLVPFLSRNDSTMLKFQVLREINFGHFEPQKSAILTILFKRQFLTFWNQPKLISRKIRVAGKWLNFHTVNPLDCFLVSRWKRLAFNRQLPNMTSLIRLVQEKVDPWGAIFSKSATLSSWNSSQPQFLGGKSYFRQKNHHFYCREGLWARRYTIIF